VAGSTRRTAARETLRARPSAVIGYPKTKAELMNCACGGYERHRRVSRKRPMRTAAVEALIRAATFAEQLVRQFETLAGCGGLKRLN
jgi:hypothetical protein